MIDYTSIIEKCIENFSKNYFHKHPFAYVYESDIQSQLYSILFSELKKEPEFFQETFLHSAVPKSASTVVLHAEAHLADKKHVDLAIWDLQNSEVGIEYTQKKISHAIEIKYLWDKSFTTSYFDKVANDMSRIKEAGIQNGYFLCFLSREIKESEEESWENLLSTHGSESFILYVITPEKCYRVKAKEWIEIDDLPICFICSDRKDVHECGKHPRMEGMMVCRRCAEHFALGLDANTKKWRILQIDKNGRLIKDNIIE